MEKLIKLEKTFAKIMLVILLGITFYFGILEGPFVGNGIDGFVSGAMVGLFILFLREALKVFKS